MLGPSRFHDSWLRKGGVTGHPLNPKLKNHMHVELTTGPDTEFMLMREGRIVSAIPCLTGADKENKIDLGNGVKIFPDNVNLEAEISPANSTSEMVENMCDLVNRVNDFLGQSGTTLVAKASHEFDDEQLMHPIAMTAGCSPEQCAYALKDVLPPNLLDTPQRTAGGHIHVGRQGYKKSSNDFILEPRTKVAAVRACDWLVGTTEVFLNKDESAPARKKLYGRAGRMRGKLLPYGFEYRTPSNFWSARPQIVAFMDNLIRHAVGVCEDDPNIFLDNTMDKEINLTVARDIIDSNNREMAKIFLKRVLPKDIHKEMVALSKLKHSPILKKNWR